MCSWAAIFDDTISWWWCPCHCWDDNFDVLLCTAPSKRLVVLGNAGRYFLWHVCIHGIHREISHAIILFLQTSRLICHGTSYTQIWDSIQPHLQLIVCHGGGCYVFPAEWGLGIVLKRSHCQTSTPMIAGYDIGFHIAAWCHDCLWGAHLWCHHGGFAIERADQEL